MQFTESFGMNLGITYTDAEYPSDCSTFNPNASDFSSQILPLCGAPLTNSSEWVGVLSANYYQPVFDGNWAFSPMVQLVTSQREEPVPCPPNGLTLQD